MADWKVTIKPVPCELFRGSGHTQVSLEVPAEEQQRANAAVALAEQMVFQVATGQSDTKYGATISRKNKNGKETVSISITAKPVPFAD